MRDPTEGVPLSSIRWPFLKRNMPPLPSSGGSGDEDDYANAYNNPQWNEDGLVARISQENYHLLYDPGTSEWWVHDRSVRGKGVKGYEDAKRERREKYRNLFGEEGKVLAGKKDGDGGLEEQTRAFKAWVDGGPEPAVAVAAAAGDDVAKASDSEEYMYYRKF